MGVAPSLSFGYGHDNLGNLTSLTENGTTTTFGYDHLDRLTSASGGFSASYAYDALGDLTSKTELGQTRTLAYNTGTQPKHAPVKPHVTLTP